MSRRRQLGASTGVPVVLFSASYEMRGMEEHLIRLGDGLVHRGYTVTAICDDRNAIAGLRRELASCGVTVRAIPERAESRLGAVRRVQALVGILRFHRDAILHTHYATHWGGDLVLGAARVAGVRAIVRTEHNPPILPLAASDPVRVRLRDRHYSSVICPSEETRNKHLQHLGRSPERLTVVEHGVDTEHFSPTVRPVDVCREFGIDPARPIVGTVSSLNEHRKGVSRFVEMAAVVAEMDRSVRFPHCG